MRNRPRKQVILGLECFYNGYVMINCIVTCCIVQYEYIYHQSILTISHLQLLWNDFEVYTLSHYLLAVT